MDYRKRQRARNLSKLLTFWIICASVWFIDECVFVQALVYSSFKWKCFGTRLGCCAGFLKAEATDKEESIFVNTNSYNLIEAETSDDEGVGGNESFALPVWLQGYSQSLTRDDVDAAVRWLERTMIGRGISTDDVQIIVKDIYYFATTLDHVLAIGAVDFLKVTLSLPPVDEGNPFLVSPPFLRASIRHYVECVMASRQGVPSRLQTFLRRPCTNRTIILSSPSHKNLVRKSAAPCSSFESVLKMIPSANPNDDDDCLLSPLNPLWTNEAASIARDAARIKRSELLVQAISKENATAISPGKVRDLLISLTDDWRSLGIRLVACLYRLDKVVEASPGRAEYVERTPEVLSMAREALKIYSPLAQRLGLQSIKTKIEESAFRILYRRQYRVASSIFQDIGGALNGLSVFLRHQIHQTLLADHELMSLLEDLQVVSRVKEPYSFWRKLLRKRLKHIHSESLIDQESTHDSVLSLSQVNDGVALRVILKAKRLDPNESDETTRSREALLCYRVQNLIRSQWPEIGPGRVKDYIANPKLNGYQSLHLTSKICVWGIDFPFEVQVRSEHMHRLAEFGYAAHWDYKLGSKNLLLARTRQVLSTATVLPRDSSGEEASSHIQALIVAKAALASQRVHVFVVGGENNESSCELLSFPVDSSISSVMADIDVSENFQVWRNGMFAEKSETLENGDVLLIAS